MNFTQVSSGGSGTGNIIDINADATPNQFLAVGTTGTDFAIVDNGSGTHTFNLPTASASARGVVSTGAQNFAGVKTFNEGFVVSKSVNGQLRSILANNPNAGASAFAEASIVSDADDFDFLANSVAAGASTGINSGAGFVNGFIIQQFGNAPIKFRTNGAQVGQFKGSGVFAVEGTTDSTSSTTGIFTVAGGMGVAKAIFQAAGKSLVNGLYHLDPQVQAVAANGATSVDLSLGSNIDLTMGAAATLTLTNPTIGGIYNFRVLSGAGSFALTLPATVKYFSGQSTFANTQTASRIDLLTLYWDGTEYLPSYYLNLTP